MLFDQIETFLTFFESPGEGESGSIFTFALLDYHSKGVIPGYGVFSGDIHTLVRALERTASDNPTAHVTLNRTRDGGRRKEHVIGARVLCVDLDRVVESSEIRAIKDGFNVSMIVESSPGKYHLYWKVSTSWSLKEWEHYQLALAQYFNGDLGLAQLTKTIRIPGVERATKSGEAFTPTIKYLPEEWPCLDIEGAQALFPWADAMYRAGKERLRASAAVAIKTLKGLPIPEGDRGDLKATGRNELLYTALRGAVREGTAHSEADLLAVAGEVNGRFVGLGFSDGLASDEVERLVAKVWRRHEERLSDTIKEAQMVTELVNGVVNGIGAGNGIPHALTGFAYDYEHPELQFNPWTDEAAYVRLLQRFGPSLLMVEPNMYAFNSVDKVWSLQSGRRHPLISDFVAKVLNDITREPRFLREVCANEEGEVSGAKIKRMQDKYKAAGLKARLCGSVFQGIDVPRGTIDLFDSKVGFIYLQNGILDLATLEVREAVATDYMLKRSTVVFDPYAECPKWQNFVSEIFAENDDPEGMADFLQELFGYSLTGEIEEQKVFCHVGDGANGKSKVLKALSKVMGAYCSIIDPDELGKKKGAFSAKTFERLGSKIEGHRVAIIDDLDVQMVWNEAFVKNLTGSTIRARAEYEVSREVVNRAKVHCGLNRIPDTETENFGILRRICLIPYKRQFDPMNAKGKEIDAFTDAELSGILNWALLGYARVLERGGIKYPLDVNNALKEYRKEQFTSETTIKSLFENPGEPPNMSPADWKRTSTEDQRVTVGNWEFLDDLLAYVNGFLPREAEELGEEKLGKILRRELGIVGKKVWSKEKNNAYAAYWIRKAKKEVIL